MKVVIVSRKGQSSNRVKQTDNRGMNELAKWNEDYESPSRTGRIQFNSRKQ